MENILNSFMVNDVKIGDRGYNNGNKLVGEKMGYIP
jgi:hypothetical protein